MPRVAPVAILLLTALLTLPAAAQEAQAYEPLGIALEQYDYPYPVEYLPLNIQGQDVRMAYMDVPPAEGDVPGAPEPEGPNVPGAVVLFHGKNFFGAYWEPTIEALRNAGYRVIVPDQIGFGKSTKADIQYSFHRLAYNTALLLDELGVQDVAVVGHSMGGMLATRFALMYPERTTHLVLENPIGLEDYAAKAPYQPVQQVYENELDKTLEGIRDYHKGYYVEWDEAYDAWVLVHYRWTLGAEYPRLAWASALTYDMVYTQPVVHELEDVRVPTLLVIGQEDRTALGKGLVSEQVRATMGRYPELGRAAAAAIPGAELVELEDVGHVPHFEAPERWHEALLSFLAGDPGAE